LEEGDAWEYLIPELGELAFCKDLEEARGKELQKEEE
jgi:hypothetical protein